MRPTVLVNVLNWLRAGYPDGVPVKDYNPLLALLRPTLNEDETIEVVRELRRGRVPEEDLTPEHIRARMAEIMQVEPSEAEVHEVAARLAAAGWPLAGFDGIQTEQETDSTFRPA